MQAREPRPVVPDAERAGASLSRLVGETRSPRRVSPNIEDVPNARTPSLPVSTRPSLAGDAAKPGPDFGHEALVPSGAPIRLRHPARAEGKKIVVVVGA